MSVYVEQRIDKRLTIEGAGGFNGVTFNAIGDFRDVSEGGIGEQDFHLLCPLNGPNFLIANLVILILDSRLSMEPAGTPGYAQQPRLENGVGIQIRDADLNIKHDLADGGRVTLTAAWIVGTTTHTIETLVKQVTSYHFRWDFLADSGGFPLQLFPGERLSLLLNDDFTGMLFQVFAVRGLKSSSGGVSADPTLLGTNP